jgi:3-phenylpropionate/cinnamic acid dioxygenase small subunit
VTNVLNHGERDGLFEVSATWMVRSYVRVRGGISRGGTYEYRLRETRDGLRIVRKKIFILDDRVVGPIDVYNI